MSIQEQSQTRLPPGGVGLPDDLDARDVFALLVGALQNSTALIFDASGTIVWCCHRCPGFLGCQDPEQVIGSSLCRFTPDLWAAERIAAISRSVREQRPITLLSILGGRRMATRYIPIRDRQDAKDWVLAVTESVEASDIQRLEATEGDALIWSGVHDLGPLDALTARELEVLALLGHGKRTKEIAETVHRSVSTIDGHRERIGQKLELNDRAELITIARRACLRVEDAEGARVQLRKVLRS
ncbi:MAG: LuxR C-terminal-related transcriptional regulator [Phycisphaerales bacterium]|nr:response regulator transcription factor [Planctomycetota bacterium]MCH8507437.1 LuxR C-terminal-related transcriptional regulator [Phycisphaerales bacterium]